MKKAIFIILDKYSDWESAYLSSQLNQDENWKVETASNSNYVKSIGGINTKVDYKLENVPNNIDLLVLIGGNSWDIKNDKLFNVIKDSFDNNIYIGAICAAVNYLAKNGFLNNYKHTGNSKYMMEQFKNYKNKDNFIESQAIKDRNLVTANGTASLEFTNSVLKMINEDSDENIDKMTYMYKYGFYEYCNKYGNPYE
ncbi:glutamine amidotransferase [Apilactobacillus timberlakei]|uniref:DJ-1/PfpI family protein n=1 Tax=Apilactobacillus timberlakei TaxID=2008380 RepID=UPI0011284D1E|nr:DJ-1/PfpI family protein [Apilactobacillus timberlakei]TPR23182.1 glutamine amidotransferase [Apilactobacillus timberlakei]